MQKNEKKKHSVAQFRNGSIWEMVDEDPKGSSTTAPHQKLKSCHL